MKKARLISTKEPAKMNMRTKGKSSRGYYSLERVPGALGEITIKISGGRKGTPTADTKTE